MRMAWGFRPAFTCRARGTARRGHTQELEGAGYTGVLVQNNVPGTLTTANAIGLVQPPPGTTEPTIPFMMITQDVANELRSGSRGYDLSFNSDGNHYFPIVQMRVTWTPAQIADPPLDPGTDESTQPPTFIPAVTEPASLTPTLLAGALCGVRGVKRRAR